MRVDLQGGVRARRGGAADQQRHGETLALHFPGDVAHFLQRGRDQSRQADRIDLFLAGTVQDHLRRHHHAQVHDLEVVAGQHHADDVLADVVHVALHRGHQHLAARFSGVAAAGLFGFDVGNQVGDGTFHHPGRLHHLRQEHLAGAEEVADHVHAGHQRAFDDVQRTARLLPCQFGVFFDEAVDAVHQGVADAPVHRPVAPGQVLGAHFALLRLVLFRLGQQAFGAVAAAIEHHVFDRLAQGRVQVVVQGQGAGVDDAHVHAGTDGVVQEHAVDGFAYGVVAPERERDVGHATGDVAVRKTPLELARRLDEGHGVTIVFLDAGGDGEDVGVEDDVLGRQARFIDQQRMGSAADGDLALEGVGLALFVEGHHHHRRAVPPGLARLRQEGGFAFLHRDRIDDGLALHAFEAGFDHAPLGAVDHHRHPRDVGFGGDQVQEPGHRRLGVEHALVHVHVDDLGAVFDLLPGHRQGVVVAVFQDQLLELDRAGDIGAFADVDEVGVGRDDEGFQAGQAGMGGQGGRLTRGQPAHGFGDGGDVSGRGAAAAADQVQQPSLGELAQDAGGFLRAFVVATEGIGQAGIGMAADVGVGDLGQHVHVRAQVAGAERAVQAHRQRPGVAQRIPEGFRGLARQRAAAAVGDRARDHHRQARAQLFEEHVERIQRRLGIERVEDRLDHQDVGAAFDQAARGDGVVGHQRIEAGVAVAGVLDLRADRCRAAGRTQHAGDPARPGRVGGFGPGGAFAAQARGFAVEFRHQVLEAVVGLRDGRRIEGIGFDDVGAGVQVGLVDAGDDVRAHEREQVVVALEVARGVGETFAAVVGFAQLVALDQGAHGAVEHQDAFRQSLQQLPGASGIVPGQGAHGLRASRVSTSKWGGRFSRVTASQTVTSRPAFSACRRSSFTVKPRLTWP